VCLCVCVCVCVCVCACLCEQKHGYELNLFIARLRQTLSALCFCLYTACYERVVCLESLIYVR